MRVVIATLPLIYMEVYIMTNDDITAKAEASFMGVVIPVHGDQKVVKQMLEYYGVFFKNTCDLK